MLTPEGMKELTKRSIAYIQKSYQAILEVEQKAKELAEEKVKEGKAIVLLGAKDEIYQIVAKAPASNINFQHKKNEELQQNENCFVIYWN